MITSCSEAMAPTNRGLWEILVPRFSNEGVEYTVEYHQQWDKLTREIAGGVTILQTAKGHWLNPERTLFVEEMIPVRVYCSRGSLDKIVDLTLDYYNQEAVLAYEISSNVVLKRRTD